MLVLSMLLRSLSPPPPATWPSAWAPAEQLLQIPIGGWATPTAARGLLGVVVRRPKTPGPRSLGCQAERRHFPLAWPRPETHLLGRPESGRAPDAAPLRMEADPPRRPPGRSAQPFSPSAPFSRSAPFCSRDLRPSNGRLLFPTALGRPTN